MAGAGTAELVATTAELGSGGWAAGAPGSSGVPGGCANLPGFPGLLAAYVRPLEALLLEFSGDPAGVYQASMAWEGATGNLADAGTVLAALSARAESELAGESADAITAALAQAAAIAAATGNATKVVAQQLQVCVTIFESVRSMICESLLLLSDFVKTAWEVLFGSWPWELERKAEAIAEFLVACDRFVGACADLARNALKAGQELVRLITDLARSRFPQQTRWLESRIGELASLVTGGERPGVDPGATTGPFGSLYNPSDTPYPGSDLRFVDDYDLGYQHHYDLGETDLTTEQLNELFRGEFGHLFIPSRVGDNTQLNMELTGVGQTIRTSLFGTSIDGITSGDIVVQQVTSDGFVIAAKEGHPEYPGEVAFRITNTNGSAQLQVTGVYDETILGNHDMGLPIDSNPAYAVISDYSIWSDMQGRIRDRLRYGS